MTETVPDAKLDSIARSFVEISNAAAQNSEAMPVANDLFHFLAVHIVDDDDTSDPPTRATISKLLDYVLILETRIATLERNVGLVPDVSDYPGFTGQSSQLIAD